MQVLEQDMRELHKDVQSLQAIYSELQKQLTAVFDAMQALDGAWDGAAQAEMKNVWLSDRNAATEMLGEMKELCGLFRTAENEYGNCENSISNMISSLRV